MSTHTQHGERGPGHWVHLPSCQLCQVVLKALGCHGDPAKMRTTQWLTGLQSLVMDIIPIITSYSPEDQGLHFHLSVQEDQGDPEERGHKANMNTFQTVAHAATGRRGKTQFKVNSRWRCLASYRNSFCLSFTKIYQLIVLLKSYLEPQIEPIKDYKML